MPIFHRLSLRSAVLAALTGVSFLILLAAYALWSARHELNAGSAELRSAQDGMQSAALERSPQAVFAQSRGYLVQARSDFSAADSRLAPMAPILEHLSGLPRIGQEVAAAPLAAQLSNEVTDGALLMLDGLRPVVNSLGGAHAHGRITTPQLIARLAASHPQFTRACARLDEARQTRPQLRPYHDARLASALRTVDRRLPQLQVLCHALVLLPDLMGYRQPRAYLVAYQNNSEIRASGGFIGSAGLLTLRGGQVSEDFSGTGINDNVSIPPPEPVLLYNRESAWLFRDSNWSPDFPTTAALERFFYQLDFHRNPYGVIDVTPQAASDILSATGPIYSLEYHRWVTAANVGQLADFYSHWTAAYGPQKFRNHDTQRKQFIGIVGRHVVSRLGTLSVSSLFRLGTNIGTGISHRDIQIHFDNPAAEDLLRSTGASGQIDPARTDFLYVADDNLSYNKVDPWIHEQVDYSVTVRPDRWLDARLTVHIRNAGAPAALAASSYGPGGGRLGKPLDYADFVRVYVPNGAQLNHDSGWTESWLPGPAYGKEMFSGYIIVPVGVTKTIRLAYLVPPNVFSPTNGRRYGLFVQHQPGSHPDRLTVSVSHDAGAVAHWSVQRPDSDLVRSVSVASRPFTPLPLPRNPAHPVVAPGHWIEPHTYLRAPHS